MRDESPSRTAGAVAFRRAEHQILDQPPVFHDPLARQLLSPEAQASLGSDPWRGKRSVLLSRLRAFLAVRSRIAEDQVAAAAASGVRQYVVLGAGLDTFACRNPFPGLRVFEVDHPRTQGWKRQRLAAAGVPVPPNTVFVPVDFETQTVATELAARGFDATSPTAISWLGVVPYLEEATVWATLSWAAGVVGDTGHIVFDYGSRLRWWQFIARAAVRRLAARVAAAGEPFRTWLEPARVREQLRTMGFSTIADLDSRELNRRYFAGRNDGLRVGGSGHVVIASRAGPGYPPSGRMP